MKKQSIIVCIIAVMMASLAIADDANILQKRLNLINSFHANFTQVVTNAEGNVIQEGRGELWIKRPNLFNWHMTAPDENILISDGETVWLYNPLIKQVTANYLKNITSNTPFMLITKNNSTDWNQYNVKQQGDSFLLVPKTNNSNPKQVIIDITSHGTITKFIALEQNGQCNTYQLKNHKNNPIHNTKFHFILPQGVTLDDQRQ